MTAPGHPPNAKRFEPVRFAWQAAAWIVLGFAVWYWQHIPISSWTVHVAKLQHKLAGYPAPHLLSDLIRLFWHTTTFPPFVGLMLASYWLPWPSRIIRSTVGLGILFWLNAIALCLDESPYLARTAVTSAVTHVFTELNLYGVIGIILWAAGSGIDQVVGPNARPKTGSPTRQPVAKRVFNNWLIRFLLIITAGTLLIPLAWYQGTPAFRQAAAHFAAAVRDRDLLTVGATALSLLEAGRVSLAEVQDNRFRPAARMKEVVYEDPRIYVLIAGLLLDRGNEERESNPRAAQAHFAAAYAAYRAALVRLDKEQLLDDMILQNAPDQSLR